jgi:hypothetical protein
MTTRIRGSLLTSCVALLAPLAAIACGGGRANVADRATPARLAPPDPVVTCAEWVQRATSDPEIAVERVPEVVKLDPAPLPRRLPKGVVGKDGKAEVRIRVLVDTLGAPDMSTFTVVKSTHATLTRSVRAAVAKWKFVPAEIGGCKVPRNFNWGAITGGSGGGDGAAQPR